MELIFFAMVWAYPVHFMSVPMSPAACEALRQQNGWREIRGHVWPVTECGGRPMVFRAN